MSVLCPFCGHSNRPGKRFCANCGTALLPVCSRCGAINEPGSRFCDECGTALVAASAEPAYGEERRLVTVLFADVMGSTALGALSSPA